MILASAYLIVLSIAFLAGSRLNGRESLLQKLSYYIGGYGGVIYFSWLLLSSINGKEPDPVSILVVMSIVNLFIINRVKYQFKVDYERARQNDGKSKDVQKYYNRVRLASWGQVMVSVGFILILMVILIGVYNDRVHLL